MDVIVMFNAPYVEPGRRRYRKMGEYARIDAELATTLIADGVARLIRVVKEDEDEESNDSEEETRG